MPYDLWINEQQLAPFLLAVKASQQKLQRNKGSGGYTWAWNDVDNDPQTLVNVEYSQNYTWCEVCSVFEEQPQTQSDS